MEEVNMDSQRMFVPALPTLWPEMMIQRTNQTAFLPFASPSVRYFYFCRNAVWLSVKMLGLEGAEILVPAYHHGVELEALIDAGAIPKFYRVGKKWDVDLEDVEKKITSKTKALYLIHYAGFAGPAAEMRALADKHGLMLLEDCALSLLAADGTTPVGSTGDVSYFCLYKTLPVPNGGALVINGNKQYSLPELPAAPLASTFTHTVNSLLQNVELRGGGVGRWVRNTIRSVGTRTVRAAKVERVATGTQHFNRDHVDLGISPLTKRLALTQDMQAIVEKRRRNYFYLLNALRDVSPPLFNELPAGACPLFYPLIVEDKAPIRASLDAVGIETIDFWRYFHPSCDGSQFPEVAELRRTVLEIPNHQDLTPEMMDKIAQHTRRALMAAKRK